MQWLSEDWVRTDDRKKRMRPPPAHSGKFGRETCFFFTLPKGQTWCSMAPRWLLTLITILDVSLQTYLTLFWEWFCGPLNMTLLWGWRTISRCGIRDLASRAKSLVKGKGFPTKTKIWYSVPKLSTWYSQNGFLKVSLLESLYSRRNGAQNKSLLPKNFGSEKSLRHNVSTSSTMLTFSWDIDGFRKLSLAIFNISIPHQSVRAIWCCE